ncbi:class C sortase, partial [Enterococcus faecium]|nr:class C sortase [Enterococcus faecium]
MLDCTLLDASTVRFSLFARIGKRSSGLRKCSFFFYYQTVITRRTQMKPKKRKLLDLLMLFLLLSGIGILAYPFVSDALNNYLDQQIISHYQQQAVKENEEVMAKIQENMTKKNQQ